MTSIPSDIELRPLAGVSFDDIAGAFLDAFADYGLTLDTTSLHDMFVRRGADFGHSYAAFHGNRIVSFIINGTGTFNGRATAYDTGTGTVKEYRGLGLTDSLLNLACQTLQEDGFEAYMLEVLQNNTPAIKIYTRRGMRTTREFRCYSAPNSALTAAVKPLSPDTVITAEPAVNVAAYASFMDFAPSWQNSIESILRAPQAFECLVAHVDGQPVGFGVSETAYGDISLLAVDKKFRRRGIASALLKKLVEANRLDKAKVLNVDETCAGMKAFLEHIGFATSCMQYEMSMTL